MPPSGRQAKLTSSAEATMRGRPIPQRPLSRTVLTWNSPACHTSTVKRSPRFQAQMVMLPFSFGCSMALAQASETASLMR